MNPRLTEADLDAANAARFAPLPPATEDRKPARLRTWPECTGECRQGRDCACADMWIDERINPWLYVLYAAAAIAAIVASIVWPWGAAS